MRITNHEEYGLRLTLRLAQAERQLSVRELAELEHLPEPTVAKVLGRLRKAHIVTAERGRNGGFSLASPAEKITLLAITQALDRPLFDASFCHQRGPESTPCSHIEGCTLRPVWRGLSAQIGGFLSSLTVEDLLLRQPTAVTEDTSRPNRGHDDCAPKGEPQTWHHQIR